MASTGYSVSIDNNAVARWYIAHIPSGLRPMDQTWCNFSSQFIVFHIISFRGLQVLWLNDNALSRIANLDLNPTVKSLYAHNNRIGTLKARYL